MAFMVWVSGFESTGYIVLKVPEHMVGEHSFSLPWFEARFLTRLSCHNSIIFTA